MSFFSLFNQKGWNSLVYSYIVYIVKPQQLYLIGPWILCDTFGM